MALNSTTLLLSIVISNDVAWNKAFETSKDVVNVSIKIVDELSILKSNSLKIEALSTLKLNMLNDDLSKTLDDKSTFDELKINDKSKNLLKKSFDEKSAININSNV